MQTSINIRILSLLVCIGLFLFSPQSVLAAPLRSGITGQLILNLCPAPSFQSDVSCFALPEPYQGTIAVTQDVKARVKVGRKWKRQVISVVRAIGQTDEKGYFRIPLKPGTYNIILEPTPQQQGLQTTNGRGVRVKKKKFTSINLFVTPQE